MQNLTVSAGRTLAGGAFLVSPVSPEDIFIREMLDEEQREMGNALEKFCEQQVIPHHEALEHKAVGQSGKLLIVELLQQAGQMGFFGMDLPEAYGGLEMGFLASVHNVERFIGSSGSYSASFMAHTSIGTMPIVLFGNEQQKQKFLPKIGSGQWLSCYALTEPGSGSDALSGKTTAVLQGDDYLLNGTKQFITNGGWADVGVVFARIDGKYSCLVVELNQPGVIRGAEEKKMGLWGSSTVNLTFENVRVPRENLLGAIGDAASIALNNINIGRLKLAFLCIGTLRFCLQQTAAYGLQRKQFGQPVIRFDMQLGKLAQMAARLFALESLAYRTAGSIAWATGAGQPADIIRALRAHALEAAIAKVEGSETLYQEASEAVKMHGGYGYIEEYHVERVVRDSVVYMIFEGTNDINRNVIMQEFIRHIYDNSIPYRAFLEELGCAVRQRETLFHNSGKTGLEVESAKCQAAKYLTAYLLEMGILQYGRDIFAQQQLLEHLADMLISIYALESSVLRAQKMISLVGPEKARKSVDLARLATEFYLDRVRQRARYVFPSFSQESRKATKIRIYHWLLSHLECTFDLYQLKRQVAAACLEQ